MNGSLEILSCIIIGYNKYGVQYPGNSTLVFYKDRGRLSIGTLINIESGSSEIEFTRVKLGSLSLPLAKLVDHGQLTVECGDDKERK